MIPVHKNLSKDEKDSFIKLYEKIENDHLLFKLMKISQTTMTGWLIYVCFFCLLCFYSNHFKIGNIFIILSGIICLQIVFIATHIRSHSLFLEYDEHTVKTERLKDSPIYYYAFYHHHHTKQNHWASGMGYFSDKNSKFLTNYVSARNIICSHWHGFSLLASVKGLILISIFGMLNSRVLFYFLGYELGVIILPFAHIWQHAHVNCFGYLASIFKFLEDYGVIANDEDHHFHHAHNQVETVYQDFSSSGLYFKFINLDKYINKFWNHSFYKALSKNVRTFDVINPYINLVIVLMFVFVPVILSL